MPTVGFERASGRIIARYVEVQPFRVAVLNLRSWGSVNLDAVEGGITTLFSLTSKAIMSVGSKVIYGL